MKYNPLETTSILNTKRYVCFDIGNVLYHIKFDPLLERLSSLYGISKEEGYAFLNSNQRLCDLGLIMVRDEIVDQYHEKNPKILNELAQLWMDSVLCGYSSMLMLENLQAKGYQIALLSNIGYEHKTQIENESLFSSCIKFLSCDVGARKPTALYYKTFTEMYPEFIGAPYIDDLHENLEMGKQFGLNPIHFALDACEGKWLEKTEELVNKIEILQKLE